MPFSVVWITGFEVARALFPRWLPFFSLSNCGLPPRRLDLSGARLDLFHLSSQWFTGWPLF